MRACLIPPCDALSRPWAAVCCWRDVRRLGTHQSGRLSGPFAGALVKLVGCPKPRSYAGCGSTGVEVGSAISVVAEQFPALAGIGGGTPSRPPGCAGASPAGDVGATGAAGARLVSVVATAALLAAGGDCVVTRGGAAGAPGTAGAAVTAGSRSPSPASVSATAVMGSLRTTDWWDNESTTGTSVATVASPAWTTGRTTRAATVARPVLRMGRSARVARPVFTTGCSTRVARPAFTTGRAE
jgi:hypothetical protein